MSAARPSPSYSDRIDRVSEYAISWDSLACTVAVASCKGEPFPSILLVPSLRRDRRDRKRDKHADSSRNVMAETGPMPSGDLSGELGSSLRQIIENPVAVPEPTPKRCRRSLSVVT